MMRDFLMFLGGLLMLPLLLPYYAVALPMFRFHRILEDALEDTLRLL